MRHFSDCKRRARALGQIARALCRRENTFDEPEASTQQSKVNIIYQSDPLQTRKAHEAHHHKSLLVSWLHIMQEINHFTKGSTLLMYTTQRCIAQRSNAQTPCPNVPHTQLGDTDHFRCHVGNYRLRETYLSRSAPVTISAKYT